MKVDRIRGLLKEKGKTSKSLSEEIGLKEPSLSRILNGKTEPRIDTLEKIAAGLGVELWELFVDPTEQVTGTLQYHGTLYRIQTKKDLEELLNKIEHLSA